MLVELAAESWGVILSRRLSGTLYTQGGLAVGLTKRDSSPATIYEENDPTSDPLTSPLTTNADGTLPGFVPPGFYRIVEPDSDPRIVLAGVSDDSFLYPSIDGSGNLSAVLESNWGIDSGGNPYYDSDGAASGEDARVFLSEDGNLRLIQPGVAANPGPWNVTVPIGLGTAASTGFALSVSTSAIGNGYYLSAAQNDEIGWDLALSAGTWNFNLLHTKGTDAGIYTVSLDGVSLGTIDGYAGGSTFNNLSTISAITIESGVQRLLLKMATKNASSSAYKGRIQAAGFRRTA